QISVRPHAATRPNGNIGVNDRKGADRNGGVQLRLRTDDGCRMNHGAPFIRSADFQSAVSPTSKSAAPQASRLVGVLETRDTADWKSALRRMKRFVSYRRNFLA